MPPSAGSSSDTVALVWHVDVQDSEDQDLAARMAEHGCVDMSGRFLVPEHEADHQCIRGQLCRWQPTTYPQPDESSLPDCGSLIAVSDDQLRLQAVMTEPAIIQGRLGPLLRGLPCP